MITSNFIVDDDAGIVSVEVALNDFVYETGTAKCLPEDEFDDYIGVDLALGRALQKLGKRLEADAFDRVHELDDAREKREAAAEAARERKRAATYKFQCEFAELINLKLGVGSTGEVVRTGSVLRDAVTNSK